MSEPAELSSCEKSLKFGRRGGHTAHDLVTTDSGEHRTISLRGHTHSNLRRCAAIVTGSWHKATVSTFGWWFRHGDLFRILCAHIDVPASAPALFFNFGEIWSLVPIRFGVVIVGNGIEARCVAVAAGDDLVGHTDNGRRVPAATEFGKNGLMGTKFSLDSRGKHSTEVFFVFGVGAVTDPVPRVEIPILAYSLVSGPETDK